MLLLDLGKKNKNKKLLRCGQQKGDISHGNEKLLPPH